MTAKILKYRGNPRPVVRYHGAPVVIILPVVRIERASVTKRPRRKPRGAA